MVIEVSKLTNSTTLVIRSAYRFFLTNFEATVLVTPGVLLLNWVVGLLLSWNMLTILFVELSIVRVRLLLIPVGSLRDLSCVGNALPMVTVNDVLETVELMVALSR